MAVEADILLFLRLCERREGEREEGRREGGKRGGGGRAEREKKRRGRNQTLQRLFKLILSHVLIHAKNSGEFPGNVLAEKKAKKTCLVASEEGM